MKRIVIPLLAIFTLGIAIGPISNSYAQMSEKAQDVMPEQVSEKVEALDNFRIEMANFVKTTILQFKEQRQETIDTIKECRDNLHSAEPSDRSQIRQECRTNLDEIKDSFREIRDTFRQTFQEFRDEVRVLIQDARGEHVDDLERQDVMNRIQEKAGERMESTDRGPDSENKRDVEKLREKIKSMGPRN